MTGYTFALCVGSFTSPDVDPSCLVSPPKDTGILAVCILGSTKLPDLVLKQLDMHPLAAASRSRLLCSKPPIMRSALNVSLRKT